MTNDITFEHIKIMNLSQQQSLGFPSVLSAISRWLHVIHKYANCSQQIHKYAKFSKQIHLIRAQLLTFPWNVQVGSHPLSLYTTRPPKQAGWECWECSTTGSECMRWFPRNMHVSAPCAGVLRVQYNRAHNYALSSRLQKCKLCLRHSCPFTTFYERHKAISIAAERGTARLMQRLQMFGSVHWRLSGIVVTLGIVGGRPIAVFGIATGAPIAF